MITESATRLEYLCNTIPALISAIREKDFSYKPTPEKWSKKEILGHLVDSAANNHQRFIRTQYENVPTIFYDQNKWNSLSHYQELDSKHIINFWALYNRHLLEIIKRIPQERLHLKCNSGDDSHHTLEWLINDYVRHLEHHLHQIVDYK
jgi:hypothetical protein